LRNSPIQKISLALLALMFAMLACTIDLGGSTKEATLTPQASTSTSVPTSEATPVSQISETPVAPLSTPTALTQELRTRLAHATVRIRGANDRGGDLIYMYGGSGTILTPDGLILTNCHVANPTSMGIPLPASLDKLLVEIVDEEDLPPVPTYFATVLASDPTLDLAIIKISTIMDGSPATGLNLPYVPLGDSDKLNLGDPIFIFGFPGIGGQTITFTTGPVSGFDSEEPVGRRAWVKTSATIAGGNSGGMAANAQGEIIGVPTRLFTASGDPADCRPIQDTNHDGVINDQDVCVPSGGYINSVRPVKWAITLIEAAKGGTAYQSPYPPVVESGVSETPMAGNTLFELKAWTEKVTSNGCPVTPAESFAAGVPEINAVFSWKGMQNGEKISLMWYYNQRNVATDSASWEAGPEGDCFPFAISNNGQPLPNGEFSVAAYLGSTLIGKATTNVGGSPNVGTGIKLTGQVVDANTSQGLENIAVVILNPGVNPDNWLQNPVESDIYTGTITGTNGYFEIPSPLQRGETYGGVVGNAKLGYSPTTGSIQIPNDAPDTLNLTIQISK